MAPIVAAAIAVLWVAGAYCLLALPRWYFRSISRYRLWHLRDDLVDDILAGRLPGEHPAVRQALVRAESAITLISKFNLVDMMLLNRLLRQASPAARAAITNHAPLCDRAGLDQSERELLDSYTDRLSERVASTMISSSWFGLAYLLLTLPRAMSEIRRRNGSARLADDGFVVSAADRAAETTPLGSHARKFVGNYLDQKLPVSI